MALRKAPERRYATADQIADDVRRYLRRLAGARPARVVVLSNAQVRRPSRRGRGAGRRRRVDPGRAHRGGASPGANRRRPARPRRAGHRLRHRIPRRHADRSRLGAAEQGRVAAGRRAGRRHRRAHRRRRAGDAARGRSHAAVGAGDDLLPDGRDRQGRRPTPSARSRSTTRSTRATTRAGSASSSSRPRSRTRSVASPRPRRARRTWRRGGATCRRRPRRCYTSQLGIAQLRLGKVDAAEATFRQGITTRGTGARGQPSEPRPGGVELRAGVPRTRPVRGRRPLARTRRGDLARRRSRTRRCRWPGRS